MYVTFLLPLERAPKVLAPSLSVYCNGNAYLYFLINYVKKSRNLLKAEMRIFAYKHIYHFLNLKKNKLGARTLGARSRGSKNVTYIQQTTDKKVNTEEKSQKYGVIL